LCWIKSDGGGVCVSVCVCGGDEGVDKFSSLASINIKVVVYVREKNWEE